VFKLSSFLGFVGGKPRSALYFLGFEGCTLSSLTAWLYEVFFNYKGNLWVCLDPHKTQTLAEISEAGELDTCVSHTEKRALPTVTRHFSLHLELLVSSSQQIQTEGFKPLYLSWFLLFRRGGAGEIFCKHSRGT
jgi:hypothetical protein